MRILITGMAGFAGRSLAAYLLHHTDWDLHGVSRRPDQRLFSSRVRWHNHDLQNVVAIDTLIANVKPDAIVHLAAQPHVPTSWEDPWGTFETNVHGTLNLINAILAAKISPRLLLVSSNEVYGAPQPVELPIRETQPLRPNNPYAVSKISQEMLARQYQISHRLDVIVARPFNHVGPDQDVRFVIPRFAQQVAEIEVGLREPVMHVGNMEARRDWTDVADVARAYHDLLLRGETGEIYNVCSGQARSVQSVLDKLVELTGRKIEQVSDPAKFRPIDTPMSYGDFLKLKQATGWEPQITFDQTLLAVLNVARARVQLTNSSS
jgi:GDP-4-dehydro-6-deoxy-D-mannose reductase